MDLVAGPLAFAVGFAALRWVEHSLGPEPPPDRIFAKRRLGAAALGVLPALAIAVGGDAPDLRPGDPWRIAVGLVGGVALIGPVVFASNRRPAAWASYPEVRSADWPAGLHVANAAAWAVYLLGYEAALRGMLLFPLADAIGVPGALAWTTALYVAIHAHKPRVELAVCVPMGLVFGGLAVWSGGFVVAWLLHLAIAVIGDGVAATCAGRRSDPS